MAALGADTANLHRHVGSLRAAAGVEFVEHQIAEVFVDGVANRPPWTRVSTNSTIIRIAQSIVLPLPFPS